jgi:hypothetical protein
MKMSNNELINFASNWINELLLKYENERIPVLDFNFPFLPKFHAKDSLLNKYAIIVDKCPMLPLNKIGLNEISEMETRQFKGMTYSNCYFIIKEHELNESLHFHELVHTYQWEYYGVIDFLIRYAGEIKQFGYKNAPLEEMAYKYQSLFDKNPSNSFDVKHHVFNELKKS